MKIRRDYTCPLEIVHDLIKGKWKPIIIFYIGKEQRCSFSFLLKTITNLNEKMLVEQLRELKAFGFIDKHTFEGYPLKVEYFLTGRGLKMLEAIKILQEIGIDYMLENGMQDILVKKGICPAI